MASKGLLISSGEQLVFKQDPSGKIASVVSLDNTTDRKIAYKVRTTLPAIFSVRPSSGILDPGKRVDVAIVMKLASLTAEEETKKKFQILYRNLGPGDERKEMAELFPNSKVLPAEISVYKLSVAEQIMQVPASPTAAPPTTPPAAPATPPASGAPAASAESRPQPKAETPSLAKASPAASDYTPAAAAPSPGPGPNSAAPSPLAAPAAPEAPALPEAKQQPPADPAPNNAPRGAAASSEEQELPALRRQAEDLRRRISQARYEQAQLQSRAGEKARAKRGRGSDVSVLALLIVAVLAFLLGRHVIAEHVAAPVKGLLATVGL